MDFSTLKENLVKKGYEVSEFDTAKEATDYLSEKIHNTTVAFGGSMTLKEMGLYEVLDTHNEVIWHWQVKEGMTPQETRKKAMNTPIYISSVNGIAKTGEVVNIDGTGNRVASMTYGHEKLYLVVSENKVGKTYEDALFRARNIAAPLNAKRLGRKTPCAEKGDKCYDCNSPERICNVLNVFYKKPGSQDVEVVLIHENLGY